MRGALRLEEILGLEGPGGERPGGGRQGAELTVAVAMADDADVLSCVSRAQGRIARFILIGNQESILRVAQENAVDVSQARFLQEDREQEACEAAVDLVRGGEAHLLMKGHVHTATFTRAILARERGLVEPGRLISHAALAQIPQYHKPLMITDCGLAIAPGLPEKVQILQNALEVARALGLPRLRVACVGPVETVNPKIAATLHARELEEMASRGEFGDAMVQGPLGLDLAVSADAARAKGVSGPVVGEADILLLPDLNAANVLYKALTCFASATMASVIAGARVPVVLTSRADTEQTRYLSLVLALKLAEASRSASARA